MLKNTLLLGCLLTALLVSTGCGDGLSSLEGDITLDGNPLPEGVELIFEPVDSEVNVPAYAATDASGHYVAAFTFQKTGIQPGKYNVKVDPSSIAGDKPRLDENDKPLDLPKVPKKYCQSIEEIEVTSGGNIKDFALTSEE